MMSRKWWSFNQELEFHLQIPHFCIRTIHKFRSLSKHLVDLVRRLLNNWLSSQQKYFTFFIVIFLYRPSISRISNTICLNLLAIVEDVTLLVNIFVKMIEVVVTSTRPIGSQGIVTVIGWAALSADRNVSSIISTVALPISWSYCGEQCCKTWNILQSLLITYFNGAPLMLRPWSRLLRLNSLWQARSCLQPFST